MNLPDLLRLLRARAELARHEAWSRAELEADQARQLSELRRFARERSPFYRELHRGLDDAPLSELPPVTKADLMERFDELVTDPAVHLADVERHLETTAATDRFLGRYRVAATGGTTGRRAIVLSSPDEWTTVLASYARAYAWGGVATGLTRRSRMAVVSSRNPTHQSAIVGATVASRFLPTLRLDATDPVEHIVDELSAFRPEALVGYASMLRILADEQIDGRLRIAPRAVFSASEVLTPAIRDRVREAFGVRATNVYAATETAGIASECEAGHLHCYEDLVVAEIVDRSARPVAPGETGDKLLVTVLFSRTQPLIRYELSDRLTAMPGRLPDDLPFAVLAGVEGREEEILEIDGVRIHPNVFHAVLEPLGTEGWQVVATAGSLTVLLAKPRDVDLASTERALRRALEAAGARDVPLEVEAVDAIPRTALGKAPLVRREMPERMAVGVR